MSASASSDKPRIRKLGAGWAVYRGPLLVAWRYDLHLAWEAYKEYYTFWKPRR